MEKHKEEERQGQSPQKAQHGYELSGFERNPYWETEKLKIQCDALKRR